MQFRDLKIGQTFDFINPAPDARNSFFRPCVKVSPRKYRTIAGGPIETHTIGSIKARVFHVDEHGE